MSIIQQIRDKAVWLVSGLIALSLVGFLLMDARSSRFFGGHSTVVGEINGQEIEYTAFEQQVNLQEDQYKQRGYPTNDAMVQNIRDNVWKQMIEDAVLSSDYAKLGLDVSDKEINDMLVGPNAIDDVKRAFTDPKTGVFDSQAAAAQINQLRNIYKAGPKKTANADNRQYEMAKSFFEQSLPQLVKMRLREKYTALLANSAYVPKWMIEKMNADNSQLASVSFVNTPYFTVSDSAVKVSDAEIQDYIDAHKDRFKQEESRSIAYVTFDASPSAKDSAALRKTLADMKADFAATNDIDGYMGRMGSESPYFNGFIGKDRIQVPSKDSILAEPKGGVYGPYLDAGNYVIAKVVDVKTLPDSVRARHILIATVNQQGQPIIEDSVARKKIDSIANVLQHGGNWDSVAAKLSDDPGSKEKGGDLGYFTADRMVKDFADFCFNGKKGETKVVKSQFGYHFIEILDQKNFEPAYKIAYISKKIETSPETDQAASGLASQFAGESRDAKAFDENVQKYHYQKLLGPDIAPAETNIPGLGANRQLVRWAYDASLGNVSEPFSVGDKYVVALLTEINAAGTMTPAKARNQVEPILRNKKKAEEIIKKEGSPASLDAAATAAGQPVQHADSVLFVRSMLSATSGPEGKVVGAAFDKSLVGKPISPAIAGNAGVYFIKVENVSAMANPNADVQQQRFMMEQQMRSMVNYGITQSLQKLATVKDYRAKFY